MIVRAAKADDFQAVNALLHEVNKSDTDENNDARREVFLSIIDDAANTIFVGVVNNEIVTSCYLNIIPNMTWGPAPYALIENVVTTAAHRRNGYGRECIAHAIDYAFTNMGCFKILLSSSQRDERTRAFYNSVGFDQSKDGYVIYKSFR